MRNTKGILMSVLMIGVVAMAVGAGTIADFSDIETSMNNYFQTGALDLKVSNDVGVEYEDPNVPAFYQVSDAWPCCDKSIFFDLENWGEGWQQQPYLYIHFKNFSCYGITAKDGDPKTEPEGVAETGGIAGEDRNGKPVYVPGIGANYGEDCNLSRHIGVLMWIAGPWPHEDKPKKSYKVPTGAWRAVDLSDYDENGDGVIKLNELNCTQIALGQLANCNGIWVHVSLHFQDFDEEDAYAQGLIPTTYFDENIPAEAKWDHWPTNALQKDGIKFDMAFELLQSKGSNPNPTPPLKYTLTTSANPGGGTTTGDGSYEANTYASITATSNTGYTFTGWIGEGVTGPSLASTTVLMDKDKTVTAKFEAVPVLCNGGFETGDFTCWTTTVPPGASAQVVTCHKGDKGKGKDYNPVEGSYFALLKTDGPGSLTKATQQFDISAGMKVKGWSAFDARDYLPFNDYARVRILDSADNVVATPWYCDVNAVGSYGDGPWTEWEWTAPSSGTYTLEFSVTNAQDSEYDSYALFDANVIV